MQRRPILWGTSSTLWISMVILVGCGSPSIQERRHSAMADLSDASTRDQALDELSWLALVHDGDYERAFEYARKRKKSPYGESAVTVAMIAAARGDLKEEVEAWVQALQTQDTAIRTIALIRLLEIPDYVMPGKTTEILVELASHITGPLSFEAAALVRQLKRRVEAGQDVLVSWEPTPWPWSAFSAGRRTSTSAKAAVERVVDGSLRLGNTKPGLAQLKLTIPESTQGTWIRISSPEAFTAELVGKPVLYRDPTKGHPAQTQQTWLSPSTIPRQLVVHLAVQQPASSVEVRFLHGPRGSSVISRQETELGALSRALLATAWGDRMKARLILEKLTKARAQWAEPKLLLAKVTNRGGPIALKWIQPFVRKRHAAAVRMFARSMSQAVSVSELIPILDALGRVNDPRSALVQYQLFSARDWGELASAALERAVALSPWACGPAIEAFQFRWSQSKFLKGRSFTELFPKHCHNTAKVRSITAGYMAEVGQLKRAQKLFSEHARLKGQPALNAVQRVRLLERQGQVNKALDLAQSFANGRGANADAHVMVADVAAAAGEAVSAAQAKARVLKSPGADPDLRVRLLASQKKQPWLQFAPKISELMTAAIPSELLQGHPALLLVDYHTTLRYRDGAAVHHIHQVMRLLTQQAVEQLGEAGVPPSARILRAVTHKADGRIIAPEDIAQKDTISFPELAVGDAIEMEYLLSEPTDTMLGSHWIGGPFYFATFELPTYAASYTVLVQQGAQGHWEQLGKLPQPKKVQIPGFSGWRWQVRSSKPLVQEPGHPAPLDPLPRVQVWSGITWDYLLESTRESLNRLLAPDFRAHRVVSKLAPKDGSDLDGARALYRFVRDNIREAEDAFMEVSVSQALAMLKGERVIVLLSLLRTAGYSADLALVNPIHRTHAPQKTPDVRDYSYLVVRLRDTDTGSYIYLDPSFRTAPFGYIPPTIRGRPAFVVSPDQIHAAVITPKEAQGAELRDVRIALTVSDDGGLVGTWQESVTGVEAVTLRLELAQLTPEQRKRGFGAMVQELLPGARLVRVKIKNIKASDKPLLISKAVALDAVDGSPITKLRFRLLPTWLSQRWIHLRDRKTPLYADRFERQRLRLDLSVPNNMTLSGTNIPAAALSTPFGDYERRVTSEGQKLIIDKQFSLTPQIISATDYKDFVEFCRTVDRADALEFTVTR